MSKTKEEQPILGEIRQVIRDMESGFSVTNYSEPELEAGSHRLTESLAVDIIRDLLDGTENPLTKDYKRTKRESAKAAPTP